MPAPRVLFVKLSSLGDVIHHFPAVSDLRAHRPEVAIDWAVEEAYAPLVGLHPAVSRTIPVALRRLRADLLAPAAWGALAGARRALRERRYDWIVDTQGLLKSVAVARLARGTALRLRPPQHPRARGGALLRPGARGAAGSCTRSSATAAWSAPSSATRPRGRPTTGSPPPARAPGLGAARRVRRRAPRLEPPRQALARRALGRARGAPRARGPRGGLSRRLARRARRRRAARGGLAGRGRRARHGAAGGGGAPRARQRGHRRRHRAHAPGRRARARPTVGTLRGHRAGPHRAARRRARGESRRPGRGADRRRRSFASSSGRRARA